MAGMSRSTWHCPIPDDAICFFSHLMIDGPSVNRYLHHSLAICLLPALGLLLSACGQPAVKDFGGHWRPVNRYDKKTIEIPLSVPYTYYAMPMDRTLKSMLTRWTSDTETKLDYRLRSDFTLPKPVAEIRTTEARDAVSQLSAIYAKQGLSVTVDGIELIVDKVTAAPTPPAPEAKMAPTTSDPKAMAAEKPDPNERP